MDHVIASLAPKLEAAIGRYRREHRLPGIVSGIADAGRPALVAVAWFRQHRNCPAP